MGGLTKGYVLRRFGMFLLTVWLGATMIFIIPRLAKGDPTAAVVSRMIAQSGRIENSAEVIEAWRARFGLDEPMHIQYLQYLRNAFTFNLGYSLAYFPSEVEDLVKRSLAWTVGLLTMATIIAFILGNLIGALMAWRRTPGMAKMLLPVSMTFTSIPPFILSILLLWIFAFELEWLPYGQGYGRGIQIGPTLEFAGSVVKHGLLPAMAIVVTSMGFWALGMRGMMITTDGEDFMILADAKGLRPWRIFWKYGVRNAILPQVTALALSLGGIVSGALLVEFIFTYPGTGYLLYNGIVNTDFTLIQGIVFFIIVGVALAVFIIDMIYPLIDPRINYQGS